MKVAIVGATGFVGSAILAEALTRPGLHVTATARNKGALPAHERLATKTLDATHVETLAEALTGHHAVIHAFSPGRTGADILDRAVAGHRAIIAATKEAGVTRLLCVGGAGSLMTPEGEEYVNSPRWNPEFEPYRQSILGTRALYYLLQLETGLDWVFLAPSEMLRPGKRTGEFRIGRDAMLFDAEGLSHISLEDYALALIDELETPRHHRQRITVGY